MTKPIVLKEKTNGYLLLAIPADTEIMVWGLIAKHAMRCLNGIPTYNQYAVIKRDTWCIASNPNITKNGLFSCYRVSDARYMVSKKTPRLSTENDVVQDVNSSAFLYASNAVEILHGGTDTNPVILLDDEILVTYSNHSPYMWRIPRYWLPRLRELGWDIINNAQK